MRTHLFTQNILRCMIAAIAMMAAAAAHAQSDYQLEWEKPFGGNGVDIFNSITAVSDGVIAVGYSYPGSFSNGDWQDVTGKGNADAIIVKYDNSGDVVWKKNFGGDGDDVFYSVTTVSDDIIAVGFSNSASFGNGDWEDVTGKGYTDAIIVKYNNSGDVIWKKNFGGNANDNFYSVMAVSDGIIAVGFSNSASFGNGDWEDVTGKGYTDAIIVKYNNSSDVIWKKNFGGNANDNFYSVMAVSDGIIAVGESYVNSFDNGDWTGVMGKGEWDAIIVKFNNNGDLIWKKNFGGSSNSCYESVTAVLDGIVAVGWSSSDSFGNGDWKDVTGKGNGDAIIVKYNNSGDVVWKRNFGGNDADNFYSVTTVSDGIIAAGESYLNSFGNGDWTGVIGKGHIDAIIVKFNNSGDVVWKKNFGGSGEDYYESITTVSDGIIAVGGSEDTSFGTGDWSSVMGKGDYDAIIVKYGIISVTDITDVPAVTIAGAPLTLTGTVAPSNATNQTITWSVKNAGTTGATISGNTLNATAAGTATITATIANGLAQGTPYTQDFSITVAAHYFDGSGTETDPYIISTAGHLAQLAICVNTGETPYDRAGVHYRLDDRISLSFYQSDAGWTPIGMNETFPFKGVFDGNRKIITQLSINAGNLGFAGLFGCVDQTGAIRNVGIEGVDIRSSINTASNLFVGGIAGRNKGSIVNCYTTGSVTALSGSSLQSAAGGIAGQNSPDARVSDCYSTAAITAQSPSYSNAGGVVGDNFDGYVSNCYSTGLVASSGYESNSGGVVGITTKSLTGCAALNPGLSCTASPDSRSFGRVVGASFSGILANNIAFSNMLHPDENGLWENKGENRTDGADIAAVGIYADPTLGGRFTTANGWTMLQGKLPGLLGATVDMPEHITPIYTITASVQSGNGRIEPVGETEVRYGGSQQYSIAPDAGYHISEVLINGGNDDDAVETGSFIFKNVTDHQSIVVRFAPNTLIGTAIIDKINPRIGDVLAGSLDGGVHAGALKYVWKTNGSKVHDGNTYTVAVADFEKKITLEITSDIETGVRISEATAAVLKKVAPPRPGQPVSQSITYNSITLSPTAGYEYSMDIENDVWQKSNTFNGLNPATGYAFYQRVAETDDTYASDASPLRILTTVQAPANALTGTVTISNMNPIIGDELTGSLTDGNNTGTLSYTWKMDGAQKAYTQKYTVTTEDFNKTITLEIASSIQTGTVSSMQTAKVQKKAAPAAPAAPTSASTTYNSVTLNVVPGREYRKNDETWQTSVEFTGLTASKSYLFYQRIAETGDTYASPASLPLEVTTLAEGVVNAATPIIDSHPQSANYAQNATAIPLTVTATVNDGGILSYKWYSNTTNSNTGCAEITNATGANYIPLTNVVGTLYYYVVVTNTNNAVNGAKTATAVSSAAKITVAEVSNAVTITTDNLPDGTVEENYNKTLAVTGSGYIRWELTGKLPNGLTLTEYPGSISGTPLKAGVFTFLLKAYNTTESDTKEFTITIAKGKGASLSETPTLETKTYNSLTIKAITPPTNGQPVEYAVRSLTEAPQTGWQTDRIITGLAAYFPYYLFARTAENDDYNVGNYTVSNAAVYTDAEPRITGSGENQTTGALKAWISNKKLHVSGLVAGETLSVYGASGALIFQNVVNSDETDIPLQTQGVYIIRQKDQTVKVVIQ